MSYSENKLIDGAVYIWMFWGTNGDLCSPLEEEKVIMSFKSLVVWLTRTLYQMIPVLNPAEKATFGSCYKVNAYLLTFFFGHWALRIRSPSACVTNISALAFDRLFEKKHSFIRKENLSLESGHL